MRMGPEQRKATEALKKGFGHDFFLAREPERGTIHLWMLSKTGLAAHVWTFIQRDLQGKNSDRVEDAAICIQEALDGSPLLQKLITAIQKAKERLGVS